MANQLAIAASIYAIQHDGLAPSSWDEIQPFFSKPIDEAYEHIAPTKRYAFLAQPLRLPPPVHFEVLLITRRPFRDITVSQGLFGLLDGLSEPGRWIIYRRDDGGFAPVWMDEAYVREAFRGFESLLPAPDSGPLRRHEVEARRNSIVKWTGAAVIAAFLARRFFRRSPLPLNPGDQNVRL